MSILLAVQFSRLLHSKFFYISILIGCFITMAHFLQTTSISTNETSIIPNSAYLLWLNVSMSEIVNMFFMMLPILAVLPFSTQLLIDKKTKYHHLMIMRSGKYKYLSSMLLVSALAGFVVISLPILLNFLLFSLTFPTISPNPFIYYIDGINSFETLFYDIELKYPLIHTLIYICLSGLIGSIFATFGTMLCLYFRVTLVVIAIPVLINLLMSVLGDFLGVSLSPLYFLGMHPPVPVYLWSVLLFCIFVVISTCILVINGGRNIDKY